VNFKDFISLKIFIIILAKGNPEKKLKWAFKMYDIDSNGSVDRQEMLKIIEVRLQFFK
jgi:Ca2+-binding EF-hand superfamily protein